MKTRGKPCKVEGPSDAFETAYKEKPPKTMGWTTTSTWEHASHGRGNDQQHARRPHSQTRTAWHSRVLQTASLANMHVSESCRSLGISTANHLTSLTNILNTIYSLDERASNMPPRYASSNGAQATDAHLYRRVTRVCRMFRQTDCQPEDGVRLADNVTPLWEP